jgi:hypothetical protein
MEYQEISEDIWETQYKIHKDKDGCVKVYDTHDDIDFIDANLDKVWTLVDPDNLPYPVVISGKAFCNRICYYVGDEVIPKDKSIDVIEESNYPVVNEKIWISDGSLSFNGLHTVIQVLENREYVVTNGTVYFKIKRDYFDMFNEDGTCPFCGTKCYEAEPCEDLEV